MLARFVEHDVRPAFLRESQIHAVGGEVGEVAACVYRQIARIGFFKLCQFFLVVARYPARRPDGCVVEHGFYAVFVGQPRGNNFKLQHADRAQNQIRAAHGFEDLYRTFFAELLQTFLQLLDFQRVFDADAAEQFGREEGDAGERQLFAFRKAVADLDVAVVRDADDVARIGFFHQLSVVRHECNHAGGGDFAVDAQVFHLHAALEFAGADAQEGDAVAVFRVHIGLDFKDKSGKFRLVRLDHAHGRIARFRCGGPVNQ